MKQHRFEVVEGSLVPGVYSHFCSINEQLCSHTYYGLRHPAGVFNVGKNSVSIGLSDVLDELHSWQPKPEEELTPSILLNKYKKLLFDFQKYYESGYEILMGFCGKHTPPRGKEFYYEWLRDNGYACGKHYSDLVRGNSDFLFFRDLNDKLKHTSDDLRCVTFDAENGRTIGYYLETAHSDGSIGPNESFHPRYKGYHTANSFNFDLRRLYFTFYLVSDALLESLKQHIEQNYSGKVFKIAVEVRGTEQLSDVYKKIMELPDEHFPSEFGRSLKYVSRVTTKTGTKYLIFEKNRAKNRSLEGRFKLVTSGDGHSKTFRIPFLGSQRGL